MFGKILIVDDEEAVLTFLKEMLEDKGYDVLTADRGQKALDVLRGEKECRIVLCDIKMPDMDGMQLLDILQRERSGLIVLMMTAYASWETVTEAMQKGAYDYIRKPVAVEDILQAIERAWMRYKLETENARLKTLFSLFRIANVFAGRAELSEACLDALPSILEQADSACGAVVLLDDGGKRVRDILPGGRSFDWQGFLSSKALSAKKVFYTTGGRTALPEGSEGFEVVDDPALPGMGIGIAGFPLEHVDRLFGFLFVGKDFEANLPFARSDLEFLTIVSRQLATSLANLRLFRLIEGTVRELQQANDKLEETRLRLIQAAKLASAGELAAGIAHEIGNPIFSIRGTAELLLSRRDRYVIPEEVAESLTVIQKQAERAQDVANSLMTFAQSRDFQPQPLDVNAIVRDTCGLMKVLFQKSLIDVELCLAEDLPAVSGDRSQISQVIFNILLNARDALEAKGGRVAVSTRILGRQVCIDVEDNGPGISEENLGKIFFPFFTTKDVGKGHGLGLSVSYGIIEKHGGKILVRSVPDKETVFSVQLPALGGRANNNQGARDEDQEKERV